MTSAFAWLSGQTARASCAPFSARPAVLPSLAFSWRGAAAAAAIHLVHGMFYGVTALRRSGALSCRRSLVDRRDLRRSGRPAFRAASIDPLMALRNE